MYKIGGNYFSIYSGFKGPICGELVKNHAKLHKYNKFYEFYVNEMCLFQVFTIHLNHNYCVYLQKSLKAYIFMCFFYLSLKLHFLGDTFKNYDTWQHCVNKRYITIFWQHFVTFCLQQDLHTLSHIYRHTNNCIRMSQFRMFFFCCAHWCCVFLELILLNYL